MRYVIYKAIMKAIHILFLCINLIISLNDFDLGLTVFIIGMLVLIPVDIIVWYFVKRKDIFHLKETEDRIWNFKYEKEKKDK